MFGKYAAVDALDMADADDLLLYGAPIAEDECLCPVHGARLVYYSPCGWICDECDIENESEELEELKVECDEAEAAFNGWVRDGAPLF